MKRISILLLLLFAAAVAEAQNQPGTTLGANNQCATINTTGLGAVGITVAGTFSGTLTPQVIIAGQTAANTKITLVTDASKAATVTSTGTYVKSVGGYDQFQMCFTAYSSGSAIIYYKPTPIINADDLSGGASGSGTVSANSGSAGAVATYAAASGSTTVGPDAGLNSNGAGVLTLGATGVGNGQITTVGTTSGSLNWGCNANACTTWSTASPIQTTANSGISFKHLGQVAANNFAGSCAMVAATTCTFSIILTYTNYLSFVNVDHASAPPATSDAASCSLSGTTVTITAAISNSLTWDCMIIGNPS